jgi:hypothetical protein
MDLDKIDVTKLQTESAETPLIYSRYMNQYNEVCAKLRWYQMEMDILKLDKWKYYLGKADPDVYLKFPLPEKVIPSNVSMYISADSDIIDLKKKMTSYEIQEKDLEKKLKEISQRSFHIRNIIEWEKFQVGSK